LFLFHCFFPLPPPSPRFGPPKWHNKTNSFIFWGELFFFFLTPPPSFFFFLRVNEDTSLSAVYTPFFVPSLPADAHSLCAASPTPSPSFFGKQGNFFLPPSTSKSFTPLYSNLPRRRRSSPSMETSPHAGTPTSSKASFFLPPPIPLQGRYSFPHMTKNFFYVWFTS